MILLAYLASNCKFLLLCFYHYLSPLLLSACHLLFYYHFTVTLSFYFRYMHFKWLWGNLPHFSVFLNRQVNQKSSFLINDMQLINVIKPQLFDPNKCYRDIKNTRIKYFVLALIIFKNNYLNKIEMYTYIAQL